MANARFLTLYGPNGTNATPGTSQGHGALTDTSAGAADAGKGVCLDSSGKLSTTVFPSGFGETSVSVVADETITAPALLNINALGHVRLADNSNNRPANGYANASIANGATGTAFLSGGITGLSGLTVGKLFLGTAGQLTSTPPSTGIWQVVGYAVTATQAEFSYSPEVGL